MELRHFLFTCSDICPLILIIVLFTYPFASHSGIIGPVFYEKIYVVMISLKCPGERFRGPNVLYKGYFDMLGTE